jgi:hypothetical protein
MRAAVQALRPILRLAPILRVNFCNVTHTQRIQDIRKVFQVHEESLKSA